MSSLQFLTSYLCQEPGVDTIEPEAAPNLTYARSPGESTHFCLEDTCPTCLRDRALTLKVSEYKASLSFMRVGTFAAASASRLSKLPKSPARGRGRHLHAFN